MSTAAIAIYDRTATQEELSQRQKRWHEEEHRLREAEKDITGLLRQGSEELGKNGQLVERLKKAAGRKEGSKITAALTKLPGLKGLVQSYDTRQTFSLKDALVHSYEAMTDTLRRLELQIEPYDNYTQRLNADITDTMRKRREAAERNDILPHEDEEKHQLIQRLQERLDKREEKVDENGNRKEDYVIARGSLEHIDLDDQIIAAEQRRREIEQEVIDNKLVVLTSENILQYLRTQAAIVGNHLSTARSFLGTVKAQMEILEPHLQRNVQDMQITEALLDAIKAYEGARGVHNASMLISAQRGVVLQRIVAEVEGTPFFEPAVLDAAYNIAKEGKELETAARQKLLRSPQGDIGEAYMLLGLPKDAPLADVRINYQQERQEALRAYYGRRDILAPKLQELEEAFHRILNYESSSRDGRVRGRDGSGVG